MHWDWPQAGSWETHRNSHTCHVISAQLLRPACRFAKFLSLQCPNNSAKDSVTGILQNFLGQIRPADCAGPKLQSVAILWDCYPHLNAQKEARVILIKEPLNGIGASELNPASLCLLQYVFV